MEEILKGVLEIQKLVYKGFQTGETTTIEWLNEICKEFFTLFKVLQKFIIFEVNVIAEKAAALQNYFLCFSQIVVCIKNIEKTLLVEEKMKTTLKTSRKFFLDRILWCLAKIKSEVQSNSDNVVVTDSSNSDSFVFCMDEALNLLSSFIVYDSDPDSTNVAETKAELMMQSTAIRSIIDELISSVLGFIQIAAEKDQLPLKTLCQKVLTECIEFEEEFSLTARSTKSEKPVVKALALESALYSLELLVNSSLLHLVYEVFEELAKKPFETLKPKGTNATEAEIQEFDLMIDRLIQIGLFAVSFSKDDIKTTSNLRSGLASIESLDPYLIPSISSPDDKNSVVILEDHFNEEITILQHYIHSVVDSYAFITSLITHLNLCIDSSIKEFNKESICKIVRQAKILVSHLTINTVQLNLTTNKVIKFYFHDLKLMAKECEAILCCQEPIANENQRILKRLQILKNTLTKLQNAIKIMQCKEFPESAPTMNPPVDISKCSDYFNTIKASALGSILYDTKRNSMDIGRLNISTIRKPGTGKKRQSLRMAIFKKQVDPIDFGQNIENKADESMNLQITHILDQLTDLSSTFSERC